MGCSSSKQREKTEIVKIKELLQKEGLLSWMILLYMYMYLCITQSHGKINLFQRKDLYTQPNTKASHVHNRHLLNQVLMNLHYSLYLVFTQILSGVYHHSSKEWVSTRQVQVFISTDSTD